MTEQTLLPPPDDMPEPVVAPPRRQKRDVVPWLYGLGFIILAVAIVYLWQYPSAPRETEADSPALRAAAQQIADMDARLSRIEQRPTPNFGQLVARVDALDGRVADQTQLASRLDTLSGRIESLSGRDQTGIDVTSQKVDALATRVAALEANAGAIETVTKRLNRVARLQEASFALESGRPLGDVPGAPEALARFAHTAPPTEAALRLRFARAEQAALAAKQPGETNAPFVDRVLQQAQSLITIRRGDDVVVGSPVAIALNRAQSALDVGDLQTAVATVETLTGQPADAMANWLEDAKALLSARSALDQMADKA
ncbi:MAG TPA: hypothetical protein DDZ81_07775 [Acetobacteraceae bacterium]|jgi:hypothetical protein|nr:hypothetical protein [Acetobacteraceae bacterium]